MRSAGFEPSNHYFILKDFLKPKELEIFFLIMDFCKYQYGFGMIFFDLERN